MKMYFPDYKNSIVNLMSSIEKASGGKPLYPTLKSLKPEEIKGYKNIIIMVIDGMGYERLNKTDIFINKFLRSKITSVFPATTAAAISTFYTGLAPQQHAITGWYMNIKELGIVSAILPFKLKMGGRIKKEMGDPNSILKGDLLASRIKRKHYTVLHKDPLSSIYNIAMSKDSRKIPYKTLKGFFRQIKKTVKLKGKKVIYAYWGDLDMNSHEYGTNSKQAKKHLGEIDCGIKNLVKCLKDTIIIITADHGFIDTKDSKVLRLSKHPKMRECMSLPFTGDSRVKYCYVHPSKAKQFEKYIKTKFKKQLVMYKSEDLIKKGVYGLYKPSPDLFDRIGDYVLIMKDNYVFKDAAINKKESWSIGKHSGVTKEEMYVPLVVIKT